MAHPVFWPKKTFFYPIGNTPPACLTQGLSPEKKANILLLGCGDPRSILHTIHTDLAPDGRDMDLTCCDWEPAILARNIVLLTMISDGVAPSDAWPVFYHFLLHETPYSILLSQCRALVQSSTDLKTWKNSKYGGFLRFCTEHSLAEIKRHWILYLEHNDLTPTEKKSVKDSFISGMKAVRNKYGGTTSNLFRSAGPLLTSIGKVQSNTFGEFWTTGLTPSKLTTRRSATPPHLNPTFVYSLAGKTFNVHYGTDPMIAFHLSPALALEKDVITIEDLADYAQSQFAAWCESLKKRLSSRAAGSLIIRFFVGESLAFCQALRTAKEARVTDTGIYIHSWTASQIVFDTGDYNPSAAASPAPLSFNVIDTSNLADHVGLVNLLAVTIPILERKPWSTMYTNTLLRKGSSSSVLFDAAFADISTLSIFLGITPSSQIWHFTTHSNKHELPAVDAQGPGNHHENIAWRFVSSSVSTSVSDQLVIPRKYLIACDYYRLADFFFSVYLSMFAEEDQKSNMQNRGNMSTYNKMNVIHYMRASFAVFLALVKEHVLVDWSATMDRLLHLIVENRSLMMGLHNYQDVMCHMFLRNVHVLTILTPAYLEMVRTSRDRFCGWKNVPPVVCIVLKIPRKYLKPLEAMHADEIMLPTLHCETSSGIESPSDIQFHNIHSSIQLCFGDIEVSTVDGESKVTIREDPKGWSGTSSLIVTFYISSWILTDSPTTTAIGLHFRSTPTSTQLIPKLGWRLTIYSTSLTNTKSVQVVRHRPNNIQEVERFRRTVTQSTMLLPKTQIVAVKFEPSGDKIATLTIREDLKQNKVAQALANGSKVFSEPIGDSTFLIKVDNNVYQLDYPFPVQNRRSKTRVARKSSYIEVEAPLRSDYSDFLDLSLDPFPVAQGDKDINLLNIHYLNLDLLPAVVLPAPAKRLDWLPVHANMMFSEAENEARKNSDLDKRGVLVGLKENIRCILLNYAGLQLQNLNDWTSVFALCNPNDVGIYTLIFINGMKFDLSNHTVVLDACAVPLIDKITDELASALRNVIEGKIIQVVTLNDEVLAWKRLLPALAERCRTWKHTDTCEYRKKGVPVALEGSEESPLCSCGKGKNLGHFGTVPKWKEFREHATRVAIGPLFTFSFMEETTKRMEEIHGRPSDASSSGSQSMSKCAKCGGPGKPTLRTCSVCKKIQYCSRECQKLHWKTHKKDCATNSS